MFLAYPPLHEKKHQNILIILYYFSGNNKIISEKFSMKHFYV
ncbi:hypothetical protein AC26_2551 [Escherichia coli 1-176-05_S3_C2]|nr:hypothetical protein AC26_2551 [Escherichia coli 1-176-05_S3_C2]